MTNQDVRARRREEKKVDKNHSKEPSKQPTLHQSIEQFQPYAREFPRCKKLDAFY